MNTSLVTTTLMWINNTLSAFAQIRRQGTPSNINDVVLKFAPDLQEAIDFDAHWSDVANRSEDPAELAIHQAVHVLRIATATLWKLVMQDGAFFQIRSACVAQPQAYELLYPHCGAHSWINDLFLTEAAVEDQELRASLVASHQEGDNVGIMHFDNDRESRGGYTVYVPENYNPGIRYPLIVSLHGGGGHGRGQIWMWLKEARSLGVVVLCPTSMDSTWNIHDPQEDTKNILGHVEAVARRWCIDTSRLLLHGISDGGTYALATGLLDDSSFTHLVPCFPSFHPMLVEMSSHSRLTALRVYLIHGAIDWMFPVANAREAHQVLLRAGVDIVYREIADLSHSYPDDENEKILRWYGE